jgi:hypothetical protein
MHDHRIVVQTRCERLAVFHARIAVLFKRLPMLCGFHVTQDLGITQVTVDAWLGGAPEEESGRELCAALEDLIDDSGDDGVEFLRGRTFARALH